MRADGEVVSNPGVAFAVDHELAAAADAAAGELKREHEGAGSEGEIRQVRSISQELAGNAGLGQRIELVQQREYFVRLVPGEERDRFRRKKRIRWSAAAGRRSRREELAARIRLHLRDATGHDIGECAEVGHRRCLRAVEGVENRRPPTACF